jgi:prepilin-type N-terminal cleavage/methylation domain-containing protein
MRRNSTALNHGYEPQSKLWKHFVLYPPLRGIVQLTNSDALRFRNWSFTNKEGFTLIEVIVTLVIAAILAALFVQFMGHNLTGSPVSAVGAHDHYELIGVVEKMNIDYNNLMNAGDPNVLVTLQAHIQAGNVVGNVPYFGQYTQGTKFITFDPVTHIEQSAETPGSNTLKVTITKNNQTITTIFTK